MMGGQNCEKIVKAPVLSLIHIFCALGRLLSFTPLTHTHTPNCHSTTQSTARSFRVALFCLVNENLYKGGVV